MVNKKYEHYQNLNEQALLKSDYMNKISFQGSQILSNCLLIIQCRYDKNPNYRRNLNHWKVELYAKCNYCAKLKLKKNNTYDKRLSIIQDELLNKFELLSDDIILPEIYQLNQKENTEIKLTEEFRIILDKLVNSLIDLIAKGNTDLIRDYISKL